MQILKLATITTMLSLLFAGCNSNQAPQSTAVDPSLNDANAVMLDDDYWAKENFDLQRVGSLLERSNDASEFERYINEEDGINNLDLNGDGYVDYISVDEFDDRDSNSRGLSLFARYGPDLIQEIATIFLYRDRPNYTGARFLIDGNDRIYGDNVYYETNWLDRSLNIASYLFGNHDYYRSPYYYDNYPSWYTAYPVVETPYYVSRVERLYPDPVFVYTTTAPAFYSDINIKSPHFGHSMEKIFAKLAKPSREQEDFLKNNRAKRFFSKNGRKMGQDGPGDKPGRNDPPRSERGDERGNPGRDERGAQRGNPNFPAQGNPGRGGDKPGKVDSPGKGQGPDHGVGKGGDHGKGGGPEKGGGPGKGGGKGKGKP